MTSSAQHSPSLRSRFIPAFILRHCGEYASIPPSITPKTLWNRGFIALLLTQFLVAFNDNLFRWLIIPIGKSCDGWNTESGGTLILTLGAATFLLPFLVLASTAGFCTDRFPRRNVIMVCKIVELILIIFGVAAIWFQSVPAMLTVLCLLGAQSAFFSPSKYGILPDIVPREQLTNANGIIAMTTMLAVIGGQMLGGLLFELTTKFGDNHIAEVGRGGMGGEFGAWLWMVVLIVVGVVGVFTSLFITYFPAACPQAKLKEPISQTCIELWTLAKMPVLLIPALGSAFFWGLGSFAQLNIDKFAEYILHLAQDKAMILMGLLSLGIAIGSVLAGLWSRRRIELGLVPCGALGIAICGLFLGLTPEVIVGGLTPEVATVWRGADFCTPNSLYAASFLFFLGVFAGLYDIPMVTFIQQNSPVETRGRVLASVNFLSFTAMFLAAPIFLLLVNILKFSASQCFLAIGVVVLILFALLVYYFLVPFTALVSRVILSNIYRRQIIGLENVPREGAMILVGNHVSFLDGFMIYTALPFADITKVRFVAHADFIPRGFWDHIGTRLRTIRIRPGTDAFIAILEARESLQNGERIIVFAEGGITRTGQIKSFERGFLSFLKKGNEDVPVVPFYIGGLFGSMFSYAHGGKMSWIPRYLRDSVMIAFGKPLTRPSSAQQVQQAVEELAVDSREKYNRKTPMIPPRLAMRRCKQVGRRLFFADSTGLKLSGYKMLTAILIARHLLLTRVFARGEQNIGALVPMSVGGCVTNAAIAMCGKTVVNLNYTFGSEILNKCIAKVGIKHILTTRKLLQRFPDLKLDAELICMEDLLPQATPLLKLSFLLQAILLPSFLHERLLGLQRINPESNITILFTSGSTGEPKGVQLSYRNIADEAFGFITAQHLAFNDTLLGILPLFHAFGYAGNFWLILLSGCKGALHFNPLEPKMVGEMARKYQCTFMPSTPTFLRNYLRRCPKEDFAHVAVMTGAEKLPIDLMNAWEEKFGNRPGEGFGATELSPCVSTNIPPSRQVGKFHKYLKDGSVGTALADVAMKIVDPLTGEDLPPNTDGMMIAKGSIVMKGYYGEESKTAEVVKNGWYWTGDIAHRDEDGFFFITGRQSRMSKIGGEMVPHILVEETLMEIVSEMRRAANVVVNEDENETVPLAVSAVPDEQKGERLIVLHRALPPQITPEEIRARMRERNLPNLWIPQVNGFYEVSQIPLLGTGKLDLAAVKKEALSRASTS